MPVPDDDQLVAELLALMEQVAPPVDRAHARRVFLFKAETAERTVLMDGAIPPRKPCVSCKYHGRTAQGTLEDVLRSMYALDDTQGEHVAHTMWSFGDNATMQDGTTLQYTFPDGTGYMEVRSDDPQVLAQFRDMVRDARKEAKSHVKHENANVATLLHDVLDKLEQEKQNE
jgi:hypothetical protein